MTDSLSMLLRLLGVVWLGMFVHAAVSAETEACLACHADKGPAIEFADGGRIEAYVDEGQFKAAVHAFLACTDCHDRSLTGKGHERRQFRSEELFRLRYSRICRSCHHDEDIADSPVHARLLEQEAAGRTPVCTDCHPAHSIKPVAGGRVLAGEATHCLDCHPGQAPATEPVERRPGTAAAPWNVHGQLRCPSCHVGYSLQSHPRRGVATGGLSKAAPDELCRPCHADMYSRSQEGIHDDLRSRGQEGTPGCVDCHGSHRITSLSHDPPASAAKCGKCHAEIYATYASSVHGDALVRAENRDVPGCIDCHGAHDTGDPRTAGYRHEIPSMCGNCHGNMAIAGRYGLSTDVVRTYLSDFHGSTVSLYREQGASIRPPDRPIAVCTDCHGTHDIRSMSMLGTAGVKALMLRKCRQCHAGATVNFPDAWLSHYTPSLTRTPALFLVDWAYKLLLPPILLGMLLQVVLHARHAIVRRAGGTKVRSDAGVARGGDSGRVRRFSAGRIVEHLVLILLVVLLATTGLAQLLHHVGVSQWLLSTLGGVDVARLVHRCAGAALAVLLLVHVATAVFGVTVRGWHPSMLVTRQDLHDAAQAARYGLGLTARAPGRDRYDYKEKFTYWLMLIGVMIMVLTGLILWFPVVAARYLPGEAIPLAASMHFHQAMVVLLLAVAWHICDAIFSPDEFPLDASIFTGYATRARTRSSD